MVATSCKFCFVQRTGEFHFEEENTGKIPNQSCCRKWKVGLSFRKISSFKGTQEGIGDSVY